MLRSLLRVAGLSAVVACSPAAGLKVEDAGRDATFTLPDGSSPPPDAEPPGFDTGTGTPVTPPGSCEPRDVRAISGTCGFEDDLGWYWAGTACVPLVGCSCVGGDCPGLYPERASCEAVQGACSRDAATPSADAGGGSDAGTMGNVCAPMDAEGTERGCFMPPWRWDGDSCEALEGCECAGADCDRVYASREACVVATAGCSGSTPDGMACSGFGCPAGQYCELSGASAFCFVGVGRCAPIPASCRDEASPVCGCDGVRYDSRCQANMRGATVSPDTSCLGGGSSGP